MKMTLLSMTNTILFENDFEILKKDKTLKAGLL